MDSGLPVVESSSPLELSIALLKAAADGSSEALFVKNVAGRYLYCNAKTAEFVGRPCDQIVGSDDFQLFGPSVAAEIRAQDHRVMSTGTTESKDHIITSTDGVERICESRKSPCYDAAGNVIGIVGTARDVTAIHREKRWLRSRQGVLEQIADGAPLPEILEGLVRLIEEGNPDVVGACLLLDREGKRLLFGAGRNLPAAYSQAIHGAEIGPNAGSCGTAAYRCETVHVADIDADPLWADYRELAQQFGLRACLSSPILSRKRDRTTVLGTFAIYKHCSGRFDDKLCASIADVEHLACIAIENHQTVQNLQAEEARFRTFVENTSDAFMLHDANGMVIDVNQRSCEQLGYRREELVGMLPTLFDPQITPAQLEEVLNKSRKGERQSFQSRHRRKDGSEFPVEVRLTPFVHAGEQRILSVAQDITERTQSEAKLKAGERRYRELADAIPQIVWTADPSGALVHLNARGTEYTGLSANDLTGWSWERVIHPDDLAHTVNEWTAAVQSGVPRDIEFRIRRTDGIYRWHIARQVPARDASGKITTWYGTCTDVEDLKQAETELRRTSELLRAVAEGTTDAIFVKDVEGRYLFFNAAAAKFAGKPVTEILGKDDRILFDPESAQQVMDRDRRIMAIGVVETEEETLSVAGKTHTFLATKGPYRDEGGNVIGLVGISTDITQRKQTEQAIRESEERHRLLFDSIPAYISYVDAGERYRWVNQRYESWYGRPRADIIGRSVLDLQGDAAYQRMHPHIRKALKGAGVRYEHHLQSADGTPRIFDTQYIPHVSDKGEVLGFYVLVFDVTEERLVQATVREKEERYRALFESCGDAVFVLSFTGRICSANPAATRMTGYSSAELLTMSIGELDSEPDAAMVPERLRRLRAGETLSFEVTQRRKDGTTFPVEVVATPTRIGETDFILAFDRDVSVRKETEGERDRLWNHSPDPLCIAGYDGRLKQVNPAWTRILGWTSEELVGQLLSELVHPEDREAAFVAEQKLLSGETLVGFEDRYRCKNGEYRWFSWNAIPLPGQKTIYAFVRDITRERLLADQFRQSQKMEAVGRLAGGIAHDFNNLLTVINGYSQLLLDGAPQDSALFEPLQMMHTAGQRAATLTSQLLAFSRKAIVKPKVLDLNSVVESVVGLLRRMIGEDIRLVHELQPGLYPILIDPGQLEQVIMNLAVNARDAMPQGGLLKICTSFGDLPANVQEEATAFPGSRYVQLSVTDTGHGISDEIKSQIFEPFFTTKGLGEGTGLGLATVYGAIQQAGGCVTVESQPNQGATFRIWLPVHQLPIPKSEEKAVLKSASGKETVLVVEDEQAVRGLVCVVLKNQGYHVLEAASAKAAMAVAASYQKPIHLLLTDLVMDEIGGRALAESLQSARPGISVLFMSGYTEDFTVRRGIESSRDAFLQKPFTPEILAGKVRAVLDSVSFPPS